MIRSICFLQHDSSKIKAEAYDPAMFRRLMDINLTGSFLVSQACSQHMIPAGTGGSIIFLSSIAGSRVLHPQQQCAYNASKAAVTQLAKSLAAEWAPHGIRVNTIAPGYMDTALNREALLEGQKKHWSSVTPIGRMGRPDELNGLAVFLASDAASFVTGAHIYADVSDMVQGPESSLTAYAGWLCRVLMSYTTDSIRAGEGSSKGNKLPSPNNVLSMNIAKDLNRNYLNLIATRKHDEV